MDVEKGLQTEPVNKEKKPAKKKAAKTRTHHEKCGAVGKTGEHGKLGTNAAK
jgi:hypothetical protein